MKSINLIRFFKLALLSFAIALIGSSCVKSVSGRTDFSNLKPTVLIPEGGLANFGLDAILFPPTDDVDTAWFHANYAATDVAPQDMVITLAVDDAALAAYNALGGAQYAKFPDSIYSFKATTVTVPKGANYTSAIPLEMFPSKINLLNNYMLPISITVAPVGSTISTNYKTIYYHLIGNPIAGLYNWDYTRHDTQDGSGPLNGSSFVGQQAVLAPLDGTTVSVPTNYYIGPRYELSFTNTAGVLTNFSVAFNSDDLATMKAGGVTVISGPNLLIADPVNGVYEFQFAVFNGSAFRYVVDKYYK